MTSKGLAHDFPLRPDFLAQVVLPYGLTTKEAKRLCAFIMTLAEDNPDQDTSAQILCWWCREPITDDDPGRQIGDTTDWEHLRECEYAGRRIQREITNP